jgi:UDP-3-O-[3-hydroxymyristoyl] glucosamine N-acyltransferase
LDNLSLMVKIQEIISRFKPDKYTGNESASVINVVELGILNQHPQALSWCNQKNISLLKTIINGTVICPLLDHDFAKNDHVNYLEVENPRLYFLNVVKTFFTKDEMPKGISKTARIGTNVVLGKGVSIGENVVIEDGSSVGDNSTIGHNTVVFRNTKIGQNVSIGCNCTIGGAGFGYEKNEKGEYEMLPHIGNVVIENNVEIAHNVCIDRAVLSSTILHENVKVDNQVHIAHNVIIGKNSLIIANSMIGGSTVIGENVWVAPSASLINKITVDDNSVIGMGAVVLKSVAKNEIVAGNPAKPLIKK